MVCNSTGQGPYLVHLAQQSTQSLAQSCVNANKLLKLIENTNSILNLMSGQKFQATNHSIGSIFTILKEIEPMSIEELAEKIKAAKEQREIDDELYGPNLQEDSQSKLLNLIKKIGEDIEEASKVISNLKLFVFELKE